MASDGDKSLLAQQKEAVDVLCKSGPDKYRLFLERSDVLDFLNEEEKQYFVDLHLEEIVYSDEDDAEPDVSLYNTSIDTENYSSLEIDAPRPSVKDPETKMVFSPGIHKNICQIIKKCTSSIKIAMFIFTDHTILQEICEKKRSPKGSHISVQILVDETQFGEFMTMAKKLIKNKFDNQEIGIDVKRITKKGRSGKAHEKFMIADENLAVTGSYNFTWTSEHSNYEQVIISRDKEAIVTPLLNQYKKLSRQGAYQTL